MTNSHSTQEAPLPYEPLEPEKYPLADEKLEQHLSFLQTLADKYHESSDEPTVYDLTEEEKLPFSQAYHSLCGELTKRSQTFRKQRQSIPVYSQDKRGALLKAFDRATNSTQARERLHNSELSENKMFDNPYNDALQYISKGYLSLKYYVDEAKIHPEIMTLIIDMLRGFDQFAKQRPEDLR